MKKFIKITSVFTAGVFIAAVFSAKGRLHKKIFPLLMEYYYSHKKIQIAVLEKYKKLPFAIIAMENNTGRPVNSNAVFRLTGKKRILSFSRNKFIYSNELLTRFYSGKLVAEENNGEWIFTLTLSLQDYITGVLYSEYSADTPPEALKALAAVMLFRTAHSDNRHGRAKFCDLTHCQVFQGIPADNSIIYRPALGELSYRFIGYSKSNLPVFHSTCGGVLFSEQLWNQNGSYSHSLIKKKDCLADGKILCSASPHFFWNRTVNKSVLHGILSEALANSDFQNSGVIGITDFDSLENESGVIEIELTIKKIRMNIDRFRLIVNRKMGWHYLKSNLFTIKQSGANYHIYGNGLGHNVGLCQYGAVELARRGRNWRQILDFYYSPKLPPIHNN
ncbi:MAG: hypothetical protein A2096_13865 [Spirochaetes bacterium GWF1_41_5]|nr:MAG: hypothetical protein A2096_13865 [Spirochaetes bacterium GWF1_41_5]HBE02730.1 hypothetical protein [Spirochaetia bacterium]